jgi:hypothetical protein
LSAYWPCIFTTEIREDAPALPRYDAGDGFGAYNAHMRFAITT